MQLNLQHLPLLHIPDVYGIEAAFGAFHVAEEVAVDSAEEVVFSGGDEVFSVFFDHF